MSANDLVYQVGITLVPIGITSGVQLSPGRGVLTQTLKWQSGGTLAMVNQAGATTAQGYILGTSEVVNIGGPATFFLAASGSTAIAAIAFGYSAGFSLQP